MNHPDSFCPLPWTKLKINSDGTMSPCCFTQTLLRHDDGRLLHADGDSLLDAWHGADLTRLRDDLLNGRTNPHCKGCDDKAAAGQANPRALMRQHWLAGRQAMDHIELPNPCLPDQPRFLYVKYGNTCNLRCRICSAHSSSQWVAEEAAQGHDHTGEHLALLAAQGISLDRRRLNRYWDGVSGIDQQISQLLPGLDELTISGGEPMLTPELLELMDACVRQGHAERISLKLLTNGTQPMADRMHDTFRHFRETYLWFSVDGTGEHFELQRHPAKWTMVRQHMTQARDAWLAAGVRGKLRICLTVSAINVAYLPFYEQEFRDLGYRVDINEVHNQMLDHLRLPLHARMAIADQLERHAVATAGVYDATEWRLLIDSLRHPGPGDATAFIETMDGMDHRRGQSWRSMLPELASLI